MFYLCQSCVLSKLVDLVHYLHLGPGGQAPNNRARRLCVMPRCEKRSGWYCIGCSPENVKGDEKGLVVLCSPTTQRNCFAEHISEKHLFG